MPKSPPRTGTLPEIIMIPWMACTNRSFSTSMDEFRQLLHTCPKPSVLGVPWTEKKTGPNRPARLRRSPRAPSWAAWGHPTCTAPPGATANPASAVRTTPPHGRWRVGGWERRWDGRVGRVWLVLRGVRLPWWVPDVDVRSRGVSTGWRAAWFGRSEFWNHVNS